MTTFDTSHPTYGVASIANRTSAKIGAAFSALAAWNDSRVTRKSLADLPDHVLEDIGMTRGDIDIVAGSHFIR